MRRGRAARARSPDDDVRALQEAQRRGRGHVQAIAAEYGHGDAARAARAAAYLRDNVQIRPRPGRGGRAADVPRLRRGPRAGARSAARWNSSDDALSSIADKVRAGGRVDARRGAGAVPARADAPARLARRWHPRPQAPGPRRHLHHRPQRQLHEHLRGALQLLRVLSAGRVAATATCSASRRSSGRSTRRSPSAATSCCCRAGTTPTCRLRGTRICSAP